MVTSSQELTPARLDAMVRLLADDDPKIHRVMRAHVAEVFDAAEPFLIAHATDEGDPELRRAAASFLLDARRERRLAEWTAFAADRSSEGLDLERGILLIAAVEYPTIDIASYMRFVDSCGRVLARHLGLRTVVDPRASTSGRPVGTAPRRAIGARRLQAVMAKVNWLLFTELGIKCSDAAAPARGSEAVTADRSRESVGGAEVCYLNEVIDQRRGHPLALAVLTRLIAGRVGLELDVVGLPGRILIGGAGTAPETRERAVYFDPSSGGQTWTLEDCLHFLRAQGYELSDEYVRVLSTRDVLVRALGELLEIYETAEDLERQERVTRMLEAL